MIQYSGTWAPEEVWTFNILVMSRNKKKAGAATSVSEKLWVLMKVGRLNRKKKSGRSGANL